MSLFPTIRAYSSNVKLFFITNIFTQIAFGIFSVIYNFYIRELGFSDRMNGNVIAMTALASAIILIPAGMISDKVGRKKAMFFGVMTSSIIFFIRSFVDHPVSLLVSAFLLGMGTSFVQVSAVPWLAENSKQSERVRLLSIHFAMMTISNVIGTILGGVLTDLFQYVFHFNQLISIRFTLVIGSVIYLTGIFPIPKMKEIITSSTKPVPHVLNKHEKNPYIKIIALFALAQLLIGFGSGLVIPYLNLYFADRFLLSNSLIGIILSLGQAATAVAMLIGPRIVLKVGEVKAIVILQLLSLPFLWLTAYTNHVYLAIIGFFFRQALMNAANPIQSSFIMARVSHSMKGLANSINQMVFQVGWASMGPISTGIVIHLGSYWGYATVFTMTSALYLSSSIFFYLIFCEKSTTINESFHQKQMS